MPMIYPFWVSVLEEAIAVAKEVARLGWAEAGAGNISVRVEGKVLITRSGARFDSLAEDDFVPLDSLGASSEAPTHRAIRAAFGELGCILHAHPPHLVAFSLKGAEPKFLLLAYTEARFIIPKGIAVVEAPPGSEELARKTAKAFAEVDVVVWRAHGAVATGKSSREAFDKLLVAEKAAKIWLLSR